MPKPKAEPPPARYYDPDAVEPFIQKAKTFLANAAGKSDLQREIMETLLIHLQIEAREGAQEGGDKDERAASRQSRKQHKELAELVMQLVLSEKSK